MKTAFKLLLLAVLVTFAHASLAAPPEKEPPAKAPAKNPAPKADEKPVVIPFELLKSRHMAIEVKVNDKGPYKVIFDTGAPMNLVSNKLAKEVGLIEKKDKGGFLFGPLPTPKTMKKFAVGGLELEGMGAMVMDHPTVDQLAKALDIPIDGLFGFPFFARYKMTIDYQKKEMTLVPTGYVPGDTMQAMMDKLLSGGGKKPEPTVVAPAAVWGFAVDKDKDDEDAGVKVTDVLAKAPAAAGGLKVGDRLLTLDGRWTDSVGDTFTAASLVKPGNAVMLVVKRDGKEVKLTVTPGRGL
jgi:hypothetical protein